MRPIHLSRFVAGVAVGVYLTRLLHFRPHIGRVDVVIVLAGLVFLSHLADHHRRLDQAGDDLDPDRR